MRKALLLFLSVVILSASKAFTQTPELFSYNGDYSAPSTAAITKGTKLVLNRALLKRFNANRSNHIEIKISLQGEALVLELEKASLFSYNRPDVIIASTLQQYHFTEGYYLRGKIKGKDHSMVALSIFDDRAGGVLSFNGQNYNLCIANEYNDYSTDDYILYSDRDCNIIPPGCQTTDDHRPVMISNYMQRPMSTVGCPVDMYFELGNALYTGEGSNIDNALKYFTILFNCVQTLYKNENILVQIREIKVWDIREPEDVATTTRQALNSFSQRMGDNGFNGDLAHYVTFNSLGGGVAWRDELCSSNKYYQTAVSANLRSTYTAFPNYSFSVEVVTHETGHNLGSPHTHSCDWPGGAIDDCYPVEGTCSPGPTPVNGGTIMSYCHLSPAGTNFANGFGPLPGNLIRSKVTDAATFGCICNCSDIEIDILTQDIGCGSPLGSAIPVITNGAGPFTFLWNNGSTDSIATGLAAGTYYVKVTGRDNGCTVIKGCKIVSNGNALVTNLTPSITAVTKCINETHTITASVLPAGTYTYQWYKDNVAISGAVSNRYTANASGAYYVKVNSSSCTGQSQTVNITIQNIPPFSITLNGASSICVGDSILLSVPSTTYSVEWLLNGSPLPGAAGSSYFAKSAGDYSARMYAPGNAACSQLSAPVSIQVKPSPAAAVSPAGNINVCKGQTATISHNPVGGNTYKWYNGATAINGETTPVLTTAGAGAYYLMVTGANGCVSKSPVVNVIVNPLPDSVISPFPSFELCQGGTLKLEIKPATINADYQWYRDGQLLRNTADNFFNVTQRGSYSAVIKNNLTGCTSSSAITTINMIPPPVIEAGNDTILSTGEPFRLHAFETSTLGVNQFEWTPSTGLDNPYIANPTATLLQDQQYTVKGTNPLGCYGTATIKFTVYKGPAIYVPGAFSPNGDGHNEVLKCFAVGLKSFKYFAVYNRAGEKIFNTNNTNTGWDGYYKGSPVDPGAFVWVAEGIDYNGKPMVRKGTIVVIR